MVHRPGKKTRAELPHQQKLHIWAEEAVRILSEEVATVYGGYITYTQLAQRVVENTGRTTTMQQRYWIGNVLGKVLQRCRRRRLPALSSLVVRATISDSMRHSAAGCLKGERSIASLL